MAGMPLALLLTLTLVAANETDAVVVRVYDAAGTPASESRQALQVASGLLGSVGVHVEWKVCGAAVVDGRDECADPPDARELIVRLARASAALPAVLGFASPPGIMATALLTPIRQTARRTTQPMAFLLGAVIAHELVHLLLGPESHTARGLMCAVWTDQALKLGWIWQISLTADQQRAIAVSVRERLDAPRRTARTGDGSPSLVSIP
jgi:hypothetical protein